MNDNTTLQPAEDMDRTAAGVEPRPDLSGVESPPVARLVAATTRTTHAQVALRPLGTIVFLYFARALVLPIVLACVAGITLKPLIRWLSYCRIRPPLGAAVVLGLLVTCLVAGFFQSGGAAMAYVNDAPEHMTTLRQRVQKKFMLYTIAVVLIILWLLGLVTSATMGGFIHILLVIAVVMILVNLISGRKRLT